MAQDEAGAERGRPRTPRPAQAPTWLVAVGYALLGLALVSVLHGLRIVRVYSVPSSSMEQTVGVGNRILVSGLPYLGGGPARGDIVVFGHGDTWADDVKPPADTPWEASVRFFGDVTGIGTGNRTFTVKRVIGLPGDRVECCDSEGRVMVNGTGLVEPYVYRDWPFEPGTLDCEGPGTGMGSSSRCFPPLVVPDGKLLVLGDHRSNSADSVVRCRAMPGITEPCADWVEADQVVGRVFAKAWPPGPIG